jgi:GNAT superfamily N-acetyltransferase
MAAEDLVEEYVRGFRQRARAMCGPMHELVEVPGLVALIGSSAEALDGRVLVTDDRPLDTLRDRLAGVNARVVNVLAAAERSHRLVAGTGDYRPQRCTAMVCDDLRKIPQVPLVDGLELRQVSLAGDDSTLVPLEEAAAAGIRADPGAGPLNELAAFAEYLRAAPNPRYLAAVEGDGVVRATAASSVFGKVAGVFFVNTDPDWRGRGIGAAMTAAALREAAVAGATGAFLDASGLGLSIYLRLGFEPVSEATHFVREV